ncbi:MAG: NAD(P)H-dependent oxidoreductase subunit E [Candidatus Micrarchaeia archaeon]
MEKGKKGGRLLMNILHEAQEKHGYISEHMLKQISIDQGIPIARLYGVVKFYTMFHTEPQGRYVIEFCGSPSCVLNDGTRLEKFLEQELKAKVGATTKDGMFTLYKTSCIGCCDEAPAMLVNGEPHTRLTVEKLTALLQKLQAAQGGKKPQKK